MKSVLVALLAASTIAYAIQAFAAEPTLVLRGIDRSVPAQSEAADRFEQAPVVDVVASKHVRVVLASPYGK